MCRWSYIVWASSGLPRHPFLLKAEASVVPAAPSGNGEGMEEETTVFCLKQREREKGGAEGFVPPQVDVCFDYISVDPSLFSRYQYFDQVTVTAYSCPIPQPTWNIRQSAVCSHSSIWADAEINKVLWRDGLLPLFWCRCFLTSAVNLQMRWMMAWMFFLNFCFSPSKKLKTAKEIFWKVEAGEVAFQDYCFGLFF